MYNGWKVGLCVHGWKVGLCVQQMGIGVCVQRMESRGVCTTDGK